MAVAISEYAVIKDSDEPCTECGATEDVTLDEDGECICVHCLFERYCDEET